MPRSMASPQPGCPVPQPRGSPAQSGARSPSSSDPAYPFWGGGLCPPALCPPLQHPGLLGPPPLYPLGNLHTGAPACAAAGWGGNQEHRWWDNGHSERVSFSPRPVGEGGLWPLGPLGSPGAAMSLPWSLATLSGWLSLHSLSIIGVMWPWGMACRACADGGGPGGPSGPVAHHQGLP